ncbi:uncharacterized protein LOC128306889 [Anopheles moucheti]|uniref:uncharacterized protein LOC128306889 n=1 Tax=Anopheles moucheti TaxID=186751 RepID=UPI0022F1072C|nr:uncharacterized protein LOC128306889 [Anopheles moucheti]
MSTKFGSMVDSESNDDSSDDNSSQDRHDRGRTKCSEKRKKHKKQKKQKKSKKHKRERSNSFDAERRHSKSDTRVAPTSVDLLDPSLMKRAVRYSDSPAENKSTKGGKPNANEVDVHKQISSRWDSSGEGEHSRQTLDSKNTRMYRSDSRAPKNNGYVDKERLHRHGLSHEQKSTRPSKSVDDESTHHVDNREREHGSTAQRGSRNENHYSRTYNKHGSNQPCERDSYNRSSHQASGSRSSNRNQAGKQSSSSNPGHHIYQTNRDLHDERCNQSTADKCSSTGSRKRGHDDSPYKQLSGRERSSSQRQNNVEHQHISKAHIKSEKTSRHDEDEQHAWGKRADNRSNPSKTIDNSKRDSESAAVSDKMASPTEKEKPNFGLSGKLTEETNKVNGVVIAYSEPPGARKPKRRWRLYPFKGEQALPTLYIHRQTCYLVGRDRRICDLPVDHPSCSKQHAVLQYRLVPYERTDGTKSQCVRPYIIDLESANGTFVNNKQIEAKRYLELREKDVLKFGFSSREYVLLHENSKEDNEADEGYEASPVVKSPNDSTQLANVETK